MKSKLVYESGTLIHKKVEADILSEVLFEVVFKLSKSVLDVFDKLGWQVLE